MKKNFIREIGLILGVVLLVFAACDDINLDGQEEGAVEGLWARPLFNQDYKYISITADSVHFYYYDLSEYCITIDAYKVEHVDEGGFYTLNQGMDSENHIWAFSRNGDYMHVRDIDETQNEIELYTPISSRVPYDTPECPDNTNGEN